MLDHIRNSFELTPNQVKIFLATFIAMSIMVGLQHLGIHSPIALFSLDK